MVQNEISTKQRLGHMPQQWRALLSLSRGPVLIGLLLLLWGGYVWSGQPVKLRINNRLHQLRTHHLTVGAALQAWGLSLAVEDQINLAPDTPLSTEQTITVRLARPVTIEADGRTLPHLTHNQTVSDVLAEVGLVVNPRDEILLNGSLVPPDTPLPRSVAPSAAPQAAIDRLFAAGTPRGSMAAARPEPIQLIIHRAIPVTLIDNGGHSLFYTIRPNVGEALLEQGLTLYLGDRITPDLGTPLSPGMRIYIQRSSPVTIHVDGRILKTRSQGQTVGTVLAEMGVLLMGQDFSHPPLQQPLTGDETIEIVRVRETFEIEQDFIPFESNWVPDTEMEIDRQEIRQTGQTGVIKTRTRIRYENGLEVARNVEDEWLDQEPNDQIIAYGTQVIIRTLQTENGPIEYWRKVSMLTTPYSAATSGKDRSHPHYGITRSGLTVAFGMAAVDPKVIPLKTNLYVPGYGPALAADTGGLILGKHIDLAFNEDQEMTISYGWRDVYILTPVPSPDQIRYVLPEWPQRGGPSG